MRLIAIILLLASSVFACPQVITPVSGFTLRETAPSVYKPISDTLVTVRTDYGVWQTMSDESGAYHVDVGGCFGVAVIDASHPGYRFRSVRFITSSDTVDGIVILLFTKSRMR